MGFDCFLYLLRKVEDFYVLEVVQTIVFPTSLLSLKENGIEKVLNCLEMTRELCLRVKNSIKQHRQGKFGAKMSSILDRNAQKQVVDVRGMVWPNDNDNDEDEEGDDEEEDDLDGKDEKADEEAEEDKHK